MAHPRYTTEEIVRRGEELYEERIRPLVEAEHHGKFLVVDIETGEYEIDADEVAAFQRAIARNPEGARYLKRIGFAYAHRVGARLSGGRK